MASYNNKPERNDVVRYFIQQFGSVLEGDTIRSIIHGCDFNVNKITSILLEMSGNMNQPNKGDFNNRNPKQPFTSRYKGNATSNFKGTVPKPTVSNPKVKKPRPVEQAIDLIEQGRRTMILMRGLPGSGKSFLSRHIVSKCPHIRDHTNHILSTDDYFIDKRTGIYKYDKLKIQEAHVWNQRRTREKMMNGTTPLIIDNTNCQMWEMKPYVEMGVELNYCIEIVEPLTPWAFSCRELVQRNSHGVPKETIAAMLERYQRNITLEDILTAYNINRNLNQNQGKPQSTMLPQSCKSQTAPTRRNLTANSGHDLITFSTETTKATTKKEENCSEKKKNENSYQDLDLASWGLSNSDVLSWQSWKTVTPIETSESQYSLASAEDSVIVTLVTTESSTQTCSSDTNSLSNPSVKVLSAHNRDINLFTVVKVPSVPPKKAFLDKSSMTEDQAMSVEEQNEEKIEYLRALFPDIRIDYLIDVLEKCKGDINWSVDLLLDDEKALPTIIPEPVNPPPVVVKPDDKIREVPVPEPINRNKEKAEDKSAEELKRQIEASIEINKDYYSDYILKLKNSKSGVRPDYKEAKPSSSSCFELVSDCTDSDTDSDVDFEKLDEETVELNLGDDIAKQLTEKFGFPEVRDVGYRPVVEIPVSFAKQLHAYYLESIFQQLEFDNQVRDMIQKQDEELAKELYRQELIENAPPPEVPKLQDVMNEQVAWNLYKKEVDDWKKLTPNNLAAKLTRQKLFDLFPTIDRDILLEILQAHDNSYSETVAILSNSTEAHTINDPDGTLLEPPISDTVLNEMKAAEEESEEVENKDIPKSALEYREEAQSYYAKHQELIQKAQNECRKHQYEVARFYSELAKKQTQLFEQANNLAATAFIKENATGMNFNTLDLHYLFVKEAIPALDIFIDRNINLLQGGKQSEQLFIITGRGKRSEQGLPRIKIAVKQRLKKRNIWFCELNPGLLKIKIKQNSLVSSQV